jgi:hypothetical protein
MKLINLKVSPEEGQILPATRIVVLRKDPADCVVRPLHFFMVVHVPRVAQPQLP